jgi:hypothetical protein
MRPTTDLLHQPCASIYLVLTMSLRLCFRQLKLLRPVQERVEASPELHSLAWSNPSASRPTDNENDVNDGSNLPDSEGQHLWRTNSTEHSCSRPGQGKACLDISVGEGIIMGKMRQAAHGTISDDHDRSPRILWTRQVLAVLSGPLISGINRLDWRTARNPAADHGAVYSLGRARRGEQP